jgi:signal transduction histidine kinase
VKHAKAHALSVTVVFGADAVSLQVKDDGVGFDPGRLDAGDGPHFGLLGMRERAARIGAQLTIVSSPGAGCTITVLLSPPQFPRR